MIISWESLRSKAFGDIDSDLKRAAILEWLKDRKEFHPQLEDNDHTQGDQ